MFPDDHGQTEKLRLDKTRAVLYGRLILGLYILLEVPNLVIGVLNTHDYGFTALLFVLTSIMFFCIWMLFGLRWR